MFIDVDGILHVYDVSKCSSRCCNIAILDDHATIVCPVTFTLIPILGFTASVYGTHMRVYMLHGLYQRRGQGAYCRPGGGSQNMFIDVHEILHMFMMFLNVHPDAIVFQY